MVAEKVKQLEQENISLKALYRRKADEIEKDR